MTEGMFDVVAVHLGTKRVRILASNKDKENAAAIKKMAILRRGIEDEIFAVVNAGDYADGDTWSGGAQ